MRLRLVKQDTKFDFFSRSKMWLGISLFLMLLGFASFLYQGLNYGIDFKGGTTVRTESTQPIDVGAYRDAIDPLGLGDIVISEVFDPTFEADQHVAMIRIQAQEGQEAVTAAVVEQVQTALQAVAPYQIRLG